MTDLAIEIRNVVKRYEGGTAVRDLSLDVPRGVVYGLLGPNGAGKTTTIRMILNIIAPDEGSIRVFGEPNDKRDLTDRIGYLPEERGLYKKMQVRRVLRFLAALKNVPGDVAEQRIDEWLRRVGLKSATKDWGLAKVDELSRGMQQQVQFIGTLLHEPELIILDEPFSGLDPVNAQTLKDTIVELREAGKTIIFSTHIMDNAERLCDAVCIIARGEKVLDGTVADVKASRGGRHIALAFTHRPGNGVSKVLDDRSLVSRVDDSNRVFEIELHPQGSAQELLQRLLQSGATIERFEIVRPSLHRIFLERVGATDVEDGMSGHG